MGRARKPTKAEQDARDRVAFELAVVDRLRQVDIAERLGVTQATVSGMVRRGRELARTERHLDPEQEANRIERIEETILTFDVVRADALAEIRRGGEDRPAAWRAAVAAGKAKIDALDALYAPTSGPAVQVDVDARSVIVGPQDMPAVLAMMKQIAESKQ